MSNQQSINQTMIFYNIDRFQLKNQFKSITENAHETTEKRTIPTQNKNKTKKNMNKERNPP